MVQSCRLSLGLSLSLSLSLSSLSLSSGSSVCLVSFSPLSRQSKVVALQFCSITLEKSSCLCNVLAQSLLLLLLCCYFLFF
jgi:hypothetical protein